MTSFLKNRARFLRNRANLTGRLRWKTSKKVNQGAWFVTSDQCMPSDQLIKSDRSRYACQSPQWRLPSFLVIFSTKARYCSLESLDRGTKVDLKMKYNCYMLRVQVLEKLLGLGGEILGSEHGISKILKKLNWWKRDD
jgi:hypothetical protein